MNNLSKKMFALICLTSLSATVLAASGGVVPPAAGAAGKAKEAAAHQATGGSGGGVGSGVDVEQQAPVDPTHADPAVAPLTGGGGGGSKSHSDAEEKSTWTTIKSMPKAGWIYFRNSMKNNWYGAFCGKYFTYHEDGTLNKTIEYEGWDKLFNRHVGAMALITTGVVGTGVYAYKNRAKINSKFKTWINNIRNKHAVKVEVEVV